VYANLKTNYIYLGEREDNIIKRIMTTVTNVNIPKADVKFLKKAI